ncbi:N-alpha-acetyltransferase 20 isoform X1 [Manis javanica]|uniref:N-alpha-acetyltransferase 20 isoform X1 n=1 Tax=Manis javanica TaxID=9974 RepID=UPI00187AAAAA|nr:N-alpha-acetyltransferase 20 isoform X1 [Manis javanica]
MAASLQSLLPRDLEVLREKSRTLLEWSCNPDSGRRREMRRYRGCRATRVPETVSRPARSGRSPIDFRRGGTGIAASRLPRRRRRDDHAPGLHVRRPVPLQQHYLAHWPEYFIVAEAPGGELMGYIMGKAEGSVAREEWHGHVTALSVAPEFRRLGLAAKLMELLEEISERKGGFFVDLFVRVSNQVAVNMYKQLGYSVYRTVIEYYSASNGEPDEDAYDMRKALTRDTEKKSIIPLPHPVRPEDIE